MNHIHGPKVLKVQTPQMNLGCLLCTSSVLGGGHTNGDTKSPVFTEGHFQVAASHAFSLSSLWNVFCFNPAVGLSVWMLYFNKKILFLFFLNPVMWSLSLLSFPDKLTFTKIRTLGGVAKSHRCSQPHIDSLWRICMYEWEEGGIPSVGHGLYLSTGLGFPGNHGTRECAPYFLML